MSKNINKYVPIFLLPLVATAVVCADGIRTVTRASLASSSRSIVETASATWQESGEGLDRTLRAHYIRLNDANRLTGEISAIQNDTGNTTGVSSIEVTLVQNSKVIARTMTNSDGTFLTDQILPGSYTLCVAGDDGFLAYGIQVIDNGVAPGELTPVPVPSVDDDNASSDIGNRKFSLVTFGNQDDANVKITAAVIPPEFSALNRIMADFVPRGVGLNMGASDGQSRINVEESVIAGGFQVTLQEDGKLVGRIAPLTSDEEEPIRLEEMNAFLLLDDEIYARTAIDDDGNFEFNDVTPDVYGFAAAGRDGFAALSFQAVEKPAGDLNSGDTVDNPYRNAAFGSEPSAAMVSSDTLQVAICPPGDIPYLRNRIELLNPEPQPEPVSQEEGEFVSTDPGMTPPGGFGGDFGGGFGFPGGPGGGYGGDFGGINIGDLIGTGLGIWVLSEVLDDVDRDNVTPQPVSPFFFR